MHFERCAASLAIEQRMAAGSPGDEIDVKTMEAISGRPCNGSQTIGWRTVAQIIPRLERRHGVVWCWQRDDKRWRCLTDSEKPGILDARVRKMRSQSKRIGQIGDSIDFDKLDDNQRRAAIRTLAIAGAVSCLTQVSTQKRLEAMTIAKPSLPDPAVLIAAFRTNGER